MALSEVRDSSKDILPRDSLPNLGPVALRLAACRQDSVHSRAAFGLALHHYSWPWPGEGDRTTSVRPDSQMFVLGVAGDFSFSIKHQNKMPVRCAALLSCAGLSEDGMRSINAAGEELECSGYRIWAPGGL